jgi:hypothetical protein
MDDGTKEIEKIIPFLSGYGARNHYGLMHTACSESMSIGKITLRHKMSSSSTDIHAQ